MRTASSARQIEGSGGANVYTLKDGKIVRYKLFQTRPEALEAVGLTE